MVLRYNRDGHFFLDSLKFVALHLYYFQKICLDRQCTEMLFTKVRHNIIFYTTIGGGYDQNYKKL